MGTQENDILSNSSGIIHVGANVGQERETYRQHELYVAWIEPLPAVFKSLEANLETYQKQSAYQYLVTDVDNKDYVFHVTNNYGESSSIYELKLHKKMWPNVIHHHDKNFKSITLPSLIEKENIDMSLFDTLVIDTQGSELLVLKGAEKILHQFKYIQTEAADFESYTGCCQVKDINDYLSLHNFENIYNDPWRSHAEVGKYYDLIYKNMAE